MLELYKRFGLMLKPISETDPAASKITLASKMVKN